MERHGNAFESVVRELLQANGFVILERMEARDRGIDFHAQVADQRWAVEVKYYRTARTQVDLLRSAAAQLRVAIGATPKLQGMLVVSSAVPSDFAPVLERELGVVVAGREELFTWAAQAPLLLDRLASLLELSPSEVPAGYGRDLTTLRRTELPPEPQVAQVDTKGHDLCEELRALDRGRRTWRAYENLCERVLRYLFRDDLDVWHRQKHTDDGFSQLDYVCRIKATTEFWQFLMDHVSTRYAVFEFKNYRAPIKQGQVLTTEKYLLEKALRRTAIIMTRKGADKGARAMMKGAMREHGKLILVIDDDNVCEMLHMRQRGEDPSDLLFDVADEFLLSLPR